jgi:hypothetical protein
MTTDANTVEVRDAGLPREFAEPYKSHWVFMEWRTPAGGGAEAEPALVVSAAGQCRCL